MANQREAALHLDVTRIVGGVHDLVVALTRADLPDEMFDPASSNQARGDDLRFFVSGEEVPRHVYGFALDSGAGLKDGRAYILVRLTELSDSLSEFVLHVQYGDPLLADYALDDPYGGYAVGAAHDLFMPFVNGAEDLSNKSTAAVTGSILPSGGPWGEATASFISASSYVDTEAFIGQPDTDFTLSTWVNVSSSNTFGTLIARRENGGWGYQWRLEGLEPAILIGSSSPNDPGGLVSLDTWTHLAVRVSASTISFFRNGSFSGQTAVSGARANRLVTTTLGGSTLGTLHDFNGYMARASIFERAVSDDYIASDYALNSPGSWSLGAITSLGGPIGQVFSESLSLGFTSGVTVDETARFQELVNVTSTFSLLGGPVILADELLNLGHIQDISFSAAVVTPPPPAPLVPLSGDHRRITIKGEERNLSPRPSAKNIRVGE